MPQQELLEQRPERAGDPRQFVNSVATALRGALIFVIGDDWRVALGVAVAILFGVSRMMIGLKQVWIGGVQVGQGILATQTTKSP